MSKHLQRDLDDIQRQVMTLSGTVEETIDKAIRALIERRRDLAEQVLQGDDDIDRREVRIEEECLKMLALHQPVAVDLRRIVTVIKINADLERIGDLALNIAERALALTEHLTFPIPGRLNQMVDLSTMMVGNSLEAFVNLDVRCARRVCGLDDEVDRLNREIITELSDHMRMDPDLVEPALHCFSASRHIERIADHAKNIAEDVIYLVEGEIARHGHRTP